MLKRLVKLLLSLVFFACREGALGLMALLGRPRARLTVITYIRCHGHPNKPSGIR